ncbi:hypothetical protein [Jeotgalibacillus terrae]|uniref:Uncharacterized protein n=1 Tax=Jeotgalibacillus terrae TaxID=587735 RepID=A0ABW5ZID7_9BACL|nr:hypothetical protein [Jeotgalibacillus terrae]MBM7578712.1 hypothetical protein [Jeotgalibacillus terrae]
MYPYDSFIDILLNVSVWWLILFILKRVSNRYPEPNPLKKDLVITLLQSIGIIALFPVIAYFLP